jgi:hypothetical protein
VEQRFWGQEGFIAFTGDLAELVGGYRRASGKTDSPRVGNAVFAKVESRVFADGMPYLSARAAGR